MLINFAVQNYRGFADRLEWDLSKPDNHYDFNQFAIKDGIVKNGIIYGPNGSGKTNFGLAIFDIENHLSDKWRKPDYYQNFVYAGHPRDLVKFEYTFKFGTDVVKYFYSKDAKGILITESLFVNEELLFSRKEGLLEIDSAQFPMDGNVKKNLSQNANNVSIARYLLTAYPLNRKHCLIQLKNYVDSMLFFRCLDVREFIGLETGVTNLEEYIITNGFVSDFASFLKEVSGQEFVFVDETPDDKSLWCKINNTRIPFLLIASTGTQSLELLYYWIKQMDKKASSFVYVDEFDAFYHYQLSYEVCKRLFAMKGQIFLSSHNTTLMTNDLLRPDCYFILKNNEIKSFAQRTKKELDEANNLERLYRGGSFSL